MTFPVRFPQFSGEKADETWKGYKSSIELAYAVSGVQNISETQRAARLLHGLTGKAKKFLDLNPDLTEKSYQEVDKILGDRFGKASAKNLLDIHSIVQKPGETALEFLTRLKSAAAILQEDSFNPTITTKDQADMMDPDEAKKLNIFLPNEYKKAGNLVIDAFNKFLMPHFIRGLRPDLRMVVVNGIPQTLDAAVKAAEDHEKFMDAFGELNTAGISLLQGQGPKCIIMRDGYNPLQEINTKPKEELPYAETDFTIENQQHPEYTERICYYCQDEESM